MRCRNPGPPGGLGARRGPTGFPGPGRGPAAQAALPGRSPAEDPARCPERHSSCHRSTRDATVTAGVARVARPRAGGRAGAGGSGGTGEPGFGGFPGSPGSLAVSASGRCGAVCAAGAVHFPRSWVRRVVSLLWGGRNGGLGGKPGTGPWFSGAGGGSGFSRSGAAPAHAGAALYAHVRAPCARRVRPFSGTFRAICVRC